MADFPEFAATIMNEFAADTGLSETRPPRRYLWTDAFAVCNFLELYRIGRHPAYLQRAHELVDQVHHVLGRHRPDDPRQGWLSGLGEEEGARHPTRGGLRIGKLRSERAPGEPFDERLEWERDGQYFHYLTKWMHALDQISRTTGDVRFNTWAIELAKAAHAAFVEPGARRMVWKMSIDLSRPLVPAMGQHDPLDGLITFRQLQATASCLNGASGTELSREIDEMANLCLGRTWATSDPLGLGGLLSDVCRLLQLPPTPGRETAVLAGQLLEDALAGLEHVVRDKALKLRAAHRLGFRELGLAIGLKAVDAMQELLLTLPAPLPERDELAKLNGALAGFRALGKDILAFWLAAENRSVPSWIEHQDINRVMLATSLLAEGFWGLGFAERGTNPGSA